MLAIFSGGSGSGKSEFAESLTCLLAKDRKKYYVATMQVFGEEGQKRVEKHRNQRKGKGFETLERTGSLQDVAKICSGGAVLLECLSNRLANALYTQNLQDPVGEILKEITEISETADLVIVTNEVFSDGISYGAETMRYIRLLGELNGRLVAAADFAAESVYGILRVVKGEEYAHALERI